MTLLEFTIAKKLIEAGVSFDALLGALAMRSTGHELKKLSTAFPKEIAEIQERCGARGGVLACDGVSPMDSVKTNRLERVMRTQARESLRRVV